jgi:2-desacetyl-2-hydroxyethyl bacteriochlorophyllide A dehydrogenase
VPETSIIIRTFNEAAFLEGLLEGIRAQHYTDHEVIVVDSGSFDGTVDIARKLDVRVVEIASRDFTFGYSLNKGIAVSRGRFLALVSAHTTPVGRDWLGALVNPLRDPEVAMTYGRQMGAAPSKFSERQDFQRIFREQRLVLHPPDFFANNANSALRRDLWEQHAFEEGLPGLEDIAWVKHWMSRGYKVLYEPAAAIHHIHTETWPQVEHRYFREAVAARAIGIRGPNDAQAEVMRELRWCLADLRAALFKELRPALVSEIARFRWAKVRGIVRGLTDGAASQEVQSHQSFYFKKDVRAVVIAGPGKASLEMITLPELKPGDVVIRVEYAGVCGTDLEMFHGSLGYFKSGMSAYPITPGHEVAGTVVRAGVNVRNVRQGDRVVVECIQGCDVCAQCRAGEPIRCRSRRELGVMGLNGGYAQYLIASGAHVHRIPDELDLQRAVLCEPLAVALKGLRRFAGALGAGPHHVGVIGAGSLGQLVALVLLTQGHRVSIVDKRESRLQAARTILPASAMHTDVGDVLECDGIVEATGRPEVLASILEGAGVGRTVLMLGLPYGHLVFDPERAVATDLCLLGSVGSGPADFREALQLLRNLPVDEFLKSTFPLEAFEKAWDAQREGDSLKVILRVAD